MRRFARRVLSSLVVLLAGAVLFSPLSSPLISDVERDVANGLVAIGLSLGEFFPGAVKVGAVPQNETLNIGLSLQLQNPLGLENLVREVSTPGSPGFRHFVTSSQFTSTYAPPKEAYRQVENYFQSLGLHTQPASNRLLLTVSGEPQAMGVAFHTTFLDYKLPSGKVLYGPSLVPRLPSALGVVGAYGFSSAFFMHPYVLPAPSHIEGRSAPGGSCGSYLGPKDLQTAYGVSSLISSGKTGSGEKVAIVDNYDSSEPQGALDSDLSTYSSRCGLPTPTVSYIYPIGCSGCNSSQSSGWGLEETLDMDMVHAMGPGATIYMTFSPNNNVGLYQAINGLVAQNSVNAISNSWGYNEVGIPNQLPTCMPCNASSDGTYILLHPILEAAAAEGISVFAASGDCGAADSIISGVSTNYPGADEDITGVGGTVLTLGANGGYGSETGWSGNVSGQCSNTGGAGGGWAPTPQPWYQSGPGQLNKGLRGVPDVGLVAGSYVTVADGGTLSGAAGTSSACPQWAGLAAIIDEIKGGDVGLINPALYAILRSSSYSTDFHQITSGSNGYNAGPGWEPISGVGTPIASAALPDIARGGPFAPPSTGMTVSLSASTLSGSAPLTVTFTASATGGSGNYPLYDFIYGDGNATLTRSPTASHTFLRAGSYPDAVELFDSKGNSTSSPYILTSVGTTPFSLSLSAGSTSPAVGTAVTFTATASGSTSTPYSYYYMLGDGTWFGNWQFFAGLSTSTFSYAYHAVGVYCAQAWATDSKNPPDGALSNVIAMTVGGATGSCPVAASAPLSISSFTATPSQINVGGTTNLSLMGTGGKPPYTYAYTGLPAGCSSTSLSTLVCTPTASGTFTVRGYVNDSSSQSVSQTLTLTITSTIIPTLTAVGVTPTYATLTVGGNVKFMAAPTCSGGACPAGTTYVWNQTNDILGALSSTMGPSVTFTARSIAGTDTIFVNATLNGVTKESAPVSISISTIPITLSSVAVSPSSATLLAGQARDFIATPTCKGGPCPSNVTYSWNLTNTLGSLNSSTGPVVTFTAGPTGGNDTLLVNATLGGSTKMSRAIEITISGPISCTLSSIAISPKKTTISAGGSALFAATLKFNHGNCPVGVSYTWSLNNTLGTLNASSGPAVTFLAGNVTGNVLIYGNATLNDSTVTGVALITITGGGGSPPPTSTFSSSLPIIWIIVGVVGVGAAAGAVVFLRRRKSPPTPPPQAPLYWEQGFPPQAWPPAWGQGGPPPPQGPPPGQW